MILVEKAYKCTTTADSVINCPHLREDTRARLKKLNGLEQQILCKIVFEGDYMPADEFDNYVSGLLSKFSLLKHSYECEG